MEWVRGVGACYITGVTGGVTEQALEQWAVPGQGSHVLGLDFLGDAGMAYGRAGLS